jgi:hypothetical protein
MPRMTEAVKPKSFPRSELRPDLGTFLHQDRMRKDRAPAAALASSWGGVIRNIRDRVGQGGKPASEPDPDVSPAPVHGLEDRANLVFIDPLANQARVLGADVAHLYTASGPYGNGVLVVWGLRFKAKLDHLARPAEHALHNPAALRFILVRKVQADNGGGEFAHRPSLALRPSFGQVEF